MKTLEGKENENQEEMESDFILLFATCMLVFAVFLFIHL